MALKGPNPKQKELIENIDGIYLADAGPGTGKTYTISLRYAYILDNLNIDPEDILLITYTNNAAENMKERIINNCNHDKAALQDAPISTFHSLCNRILNRYGFEASKIIGVDDQITPSIRIMDNEVLEKQEFRMYMQQFIAEHPEYNDYCRSLYNQAGMLGLIKSLAAKGIFPTRDGWFRNSERYLDGNYEEFKRLFDKKNEAIPSAKGFRQSELRGRLNDYKDKCFTSDAPSMEDLRGKGKQVPEIFSELSFNEERGGLKKFVHDIYFGYIKYSLGRNYLNFSFMMMLAYSLLYEDHELREQLKYEYVMIDEFQDTNEIQFKLAMLLSKRNLCVVGDWKQSIFAFQYASVDNIIQFEERLKKYKEELNQDYQRIDYSVEHVHEIPLEENHRSTQHIIDFSEQALVLQATKNEVIDKEEIRSMITHLKAVNNAGPTEIAAYTGEDQKKVILWKIAEIVNNPHYTIEEERDLCRKLEYSDIAILTRTRNFGLELYSLAEEHGIPVAYEGGVELFRTAPALMLIAWLRIINDKDSKKGWAVILEDASYTLDEAKYILDTKEYPEDMLEFRGGLKELDSIGAIARTIFEKYGIHGAFADRVIEVLQNTFNNTDMNMGDLINFIEDNIEAGATYEVDSGQDENAFKIQTIHSAKGLEYPVVILPDLGTRQGGFGRAIEYREPLGIRQSKIYAEESFPYTYDNWKTYVMYKCLSGDYDEERRLLYVAMTRAKNYLFLTADVDGPSEFFNNLTVDPEEVEPVIEPVPLTMLDRKVLMVERPEIPGTVKLSCHSLFNESCINFEGEGMGVEYGLRVHQFAEKYAMGEDVKPANQDEKNVKKFIDSLNGEIICEQECLLPLDLGGRRVLFEGRIDFLHFHDDRVEIIDFKTDRSRSAEKEYFKQLSLYYHVLDGIYRGKEIEVYIFYTENGEKILVQPLTIGQIKESVRDVLSRYALSERAI